MNSYKVISGTHKGQYLFGTVKIIAGQKRVVNRDKIGESFPISFCVKADHPLNGLCCAMYDANGMRFNIYGKAY